MIGSLTSLDRTTVKLATAIAAGLMLLPLGGCAVVTVAGAAVSVASTAVNVGVAAGSAAVDVTTTVVKGAVKVGGAVVDTVVE
ncbi:hypothetical protein ACFQAT_18995 [Undibacterium arcticum]|uniref:hypothetical protein n=1 Tax=Undibacterium arcticum TaxID=1762892 RepID=UPI0036116C60